MLVVSELVKYVNHHKLAPEHMQLKKKALLLLVESHISSCFTKEALQEDFEAGSNRHVRVSARRDRKESDASGSDVRCQSEESDEEVLDVVEGQVSQSETSGDECNPVNEVLP